jgi:hypothetical protein
MRSRRRRGSRRSSGLLSGGASGDHVAHAARWGSLGEDSVRGRGGHGHMHGNLGVRGTLGGGILVRSIGVSAGGVLGVVVNGASGCRRGSHRHMHEWDILGIIVGRTGS